MVVVQFHLFVDISVRQIFIHFVEVALAENEDVAIVGRLLVLLESF